VRIAVICYHLDVEIAFPEEQMPDAIVSLPISQVHPDPDQPRKTFTAESIADLAASIRENGLQQPVKVRRIAGDDYVLIFGERRYRAHLHNRAETIDVRIPGEVGHRFRNEVGH
jgi:ParB/RepB/Spo0J family partition protein